MGVRFENSLEEGNFILDFDPILVFQDNYNLVKIIKDKNLSFSVLLLC